VSISEKRKIMRRGERARAVVLDISHFVITYPYKTLITYYIRRNLHPDVVFHLEAISSVLLLRIRLALDRAVTPLSIDRILQN
jgi:hypothetical protein